MRKESGMTPKFLTWMMDLSFTQIGKTKDETNLGKKIS